MLTQTAGKKRWTKGYDPFDQTPRYTFEGRDPSYTMSTIEVVIWCEKVSDYGYGAPYHREYFGSVFNSKTECGDKVGGYRKLSDAKKAVEELFDEYVKLFPDDKEER